MSTSASKAAFVDASNSAATCRLTDTALSKEERRRDSHNLSDFAFSIDDDGRSLSMCEVEDEAASLGYYSQQPTTPVSSVPVTNRRQHGLLNSFVQGNFYGSIRGGGFKGVALFTKRHIGYVFSAFTSGYMCATVNYVLTQLDPAVLGLESKVGLRGWLDLQWGVVLLLGVISDAFAPFGLRRNAYIVFGWVCASAIWTALFVFSQYSTHIFGSTTPPPAVATTGITLAMLALVVATNALDIRVIELSQQENLLSRGCLVATYQSVRITAQVLLHALVLAIAGVSMTASGVWYLTLPFPVRFLILHLALVALLPIPFVLRFAHEERLKPAAAAPHFGETLRQFWQSAQQKAIRQLIVFNCVLYFFAYFDYGDVIWALWLWARESPQVLRLRFVIGDFAFVVGLLSWRRYDVNANWVSSIAIVIVSWSFMYLAGNALVAFDIARVSWLPTLMSVLRAALRVLLLLSAFVPTIEIAQQGSEGTTFGLLSSFQSIAKVLGVQLSSAIRFSCFGESVAISTSDIAVSSSATQLKVFWGVLILTSAKLLALVALWFCPHGKLDAQQLRIYGGYSRITLFALVGVYVASYLAASYLEYRHLL